MLPDDAVGDGEPQAGSVSPARPGQFRGSHIRPRATPGLRATLELENGGTIDFIPTNRRIPRNSVIRYGHARAANLQKVKVQRGASRAEKRGFQC